MTGRVGLTEKQQVTLDGLIAKDKLTDNQQTTKKDLEAKKADKTLSEGLQTHLRNIHRSAKWGRKKHHTNKYVEKGIGMEKRATTLYQDHLNKTKEFSEKVFFMENWTRLNNDFVTGEPDLVLGNDINNCEIGFDTKCSWDWTTFPYAVDELDSAYEWQNQTYMWLTGAKEWRTVYCLVNTPSRLLLNEKNRWYWAMDAPNEDEQAFIDKMLELERDHIYNLAEFRKDFPGHDLAHDAYAEEWTHDIPESERVMEKVSIYSPEKIESLKERIILSRDYLNKL